MTAPQLFDRIRDADRWTGYRLTACPVTRKQYQALRTAGLVDERNWLGGIDRIIDNAGNVHEVHWGLAIYY